MLPQFLDFSDPIEPQTTSDTSQKLTEPKDVESPHRPLEALKELHRTLETLGLAQCDVENLREPQGTSANLIEFVGTLANIGERFIENL